MPKGEKPRREMRCLIYLWLLVTAPMAEPADVVTTVPGAAWQRYSIDASSRGADGVKLGDHNQDGLIDIVTGWEEGGVVRIYENPGPDRAREAWPHITVGEVRHVEEAIFVDLDGDGRQEVVSGSEGGTRTLYWHRPRDGGWRTVAFPATQNAQMWMQAVSLDLDAQWGQDLLLGSKGDGAAVGWLQAPRQAESLDAWSYHRLREAGWIMSLLPRDLDGDGDVDLVLSDRKGRRSGLFWLENPGPQANRRHVAWHEHPIGLLGTEVMFADLGDVNGDGLLDVAAAVKPAKIALLLGTKEGNWKERILHLDDSHAGDAKAVKIADVDGDGLADLIYTCESASGSREGVVWLEQERNAPWRQHSLGGPAGVKFDLLQTLDLDGDGDLDVITCEERDLLGVVWYANPTHGEVDAVPAIRQK